jgi:hypothetical protein
MSTFWTATMDRLLTTSNRIFGKTTIYQRPDVESFTIVGVPEFVDRLEDPNTGPFYSIFYRIADFDTSGLFASVTATFTSVPNTNGTITFDGVTYTIVNTLDNAVPNQFFRGGSPFACAESLASAINEVEGYAGSAYSAATVAHPTCTATYAGDGSGNATVTVSYKVPGSVGNLVTADEDMTAVTLSSKLFSGGLPQVNDLLTLLGTVYRVSDVPEPDTEGGLHVRLEKKAL